MKATQFTSWQPVKVIDDELESHGRAGTVKSASDYESDDGKRQLVDVQLDGDTDITVFETKQVAPL